MVAEILKGHVLPPFVNLMNSLRRTSKDAKVNGVNVKLDWKLVVCKGAHTQAQAGEALEHGLQQGVARSESVTETDNADNADGLAGGAKPDVLWESAAEKASAQGGDEDTIKKATVRIYRAMKRKQKTKENKKLIVVA